MYNWEIPDYLAVKNGHLTMDGVDVVELAEKFGTPYYVFSEKRLRANVREILDAFRSIHPKTTLHYAAKCESTLANLQILREAGSDIEVNSGGELYKALRAGFDGRQIVFNGVSKTEREIEDAVKHDLKSINVDSEFEVQRVAEMARRLHKRANIVFRFVPEIETGVVKGNETGTHESKFGITIDQLIPAVQKALSENEVLNVCGLSMHIGTQTYDVNAFRDAFLVMLQTVMKVYHATGHKMTILDIGGGFPVRHLREIAPSQYMPKNIYHMLRGNLSVQEIATAVVGELHPAKVAAWAGEQYRDFFKDCELVLESGRKVVADAGILLSRVENQKIRESIDEPWVMLDAGFNTLLEVKTYYWYYHMVVANKLDEPHLKDFKVAGPCCDSGDVHYDIDFHVNLPDYRRFPESTTVGDVVAFLDAAAYGTPTMMNYNGRPRAGILLIHADGRISVSRRPEDYGDLIRDEFDLADLRK